MADTPKTVPTTVDVDAFIDAVENPVRRADARMLKTLMEKVTGEPATMWGPSIVGFGSYHYTYASGRQGDAAAVGFSPRKASTTVYLADGFERRGGLLARLGPHTTSVSCLYIKRLEDVDLSVLEELLRASYRTVVEDWPSSST